MRLSENVSTASFSIEHVTLLNSPLPNISRQLSSQSTIIMAGNNEAEILIQLNGDDVYFTKVTVGLYTTLANTWLSIADGAVVDGSGYYLLSDAPLQAMSLTYDTTAPQLIEFNLFDLDGGLAIYFEVRRPN